MADNSEIKTQKIKINRNVAVVGADTAAMQSALTLAKLGHKVTIITHESKPSEQIKNVKNIEVLDLAVLESVDGEFGNFHLSVQSEGKQKNFTAGAVILSQPNCYVDLDKLAEMIDISNVPGRIAVVLDIVKQQTRAVWQRVLSTAMTLVERFGSEVAIYCQHARVAATGLENLYRTARAAGVLIIKFDTKPTIIEQQGGITIRTYDEILGAEISKQFDLLITADIADDSSFTKGLRQLRRGPAGELQYDNVWLLGTNTNCKGIFVIGDARGNSDAGDALATAGEISLLLSKAEIEIAEDAAVVDAEKCVLCLTCRRVCPHGAISIDKENETAKVSLLSCMRCGACAAQCPAGAIQLPRYSDDQTRAKLAVKPKMTLFACENSALPAAEATGFKPDDNINLIKVPCAGKVDSRDVLAALEKGAEKVMIIACHPESCQYLTGASRARNAVNRIDDMLSKAGSDSERVVFRGISAVEPKKFIEYLKE